MHGGELPALAIQDGPEPVQAETLGGATASSCGAHERALQPKNSHALSGHKRVADSPATLVAARQGRAKMPVECVFTEPPQAMRVYAQMHNKDASEGACGWHRLH
jgi:hypothetical protein